MSKNEIIQNLKTIINKWQMDEDMYSDTMTINIDQTIINSLESAIHEIKNKPELHANIGDSIWCTTRPVCYALDRVTEKQLDEPIQKTIKKIEITKQHIGYHVDSEIYKHEEFGEKWFLDKADAINCINNRKDKEK